jgi:uncharacterized protein with beta-barrel porin domain
MPCVPIRGFGYTLCDRHAPNEVERDVPARRNLRRPGDAGPDQQGVNSRVFDAFKESGGVPALAVRDQRSVFGMRGEGMLSGDEKGGVRLGGTVGLRHAMGDRVAEPIVALAAAPGQSFAVRSAQIDSFAVVANLDLTDSLSLRLGYTGVRGPSAREHAPAPRSA